MSGETLIGAEEILSQNINGKYMYEGGGYEI